LLKTAIDTLVASLISIGVFQSPTFVIESLFGYTAIFMILLFVVVLIVVYATMYGDRRYAYNIFVILIISFIEVLWIGYALEKPIEMILVVFLITTPSVLVFDRLLG
jgi:hypothetical protein